MGKIVVLEGTDCSGKTTQYNKLCERLKNENIDFATDSFPDYESESSYFVREYLAGKYGMHPSDVDAKTASTFFSLDRYNSYKTKEWGEKYRNGGNVLFARYITSNVLHQACKLKTEKEKDEFVKWLYDFEVGILGIPKEDIVIMLKMPFEKICELKKIRGVTSSGTKDIHEEDQAYLKEAYENSIWMAEKYDWKIINCIDKNNNIRTIEDIHEEIYKIIIEAFNKN